MSEEQGPQNSDAFVERSSSKDVPAIVFLGENQHIVLPSFRDDQRKALAHLGISFICPIIPKSIRELQAESNGRVGRIIDPDVPIDLTPLATEIALDPTHPFIPESLGLDFENQLQFLIELSMRIEQKVPGVAVGIGHAPIYIQLWEALKDPCPYYAHTATIIRDPYFIEVGRARPESVITVHKFDRYFSHPRSGLFPLAVPVAKK